MNAWNFTATSYISGTPAVQRGVLYFCDFGGFLFAVDAFQGTEIWRYNLSSATGISGDYCRATPTLTPSNLYIGSTASAFFLKFDLDGNFQSKVSLNAHPAAIITMGATFFDNKLYVGVSSNEEGLAIDPSYPCCSFRGSFHCLDANTLEIIWTAYSFPETYPTGPGGVSGVAYWGSSPVIDTRRDSVYVSTGNPYQIPQQWQDCYALNGSKACIPSDVLFNAVISYDLCTGAVKWASRFSWYDAWSASCFYAGPNCPTVPGKDADFGMAPILTRNGTQDILLITQKSGVAWSLDPESGETLNFVLSSPGGSGGGSNWGAATDGENYFVSAANTNLINWTFVNPVPPCASTTTKGFFSKLCVSTLDIQCQVPIPDSNPANAVGTFGEGPPTVVNDLWIATSTNPTGKQVHLIDKNSCQILKSFSVGTVVYGGVSTYLNCIYVGTGYKPYYNPIWNAGQSKLFAFCIPFQENSRLAKENKRVKASKHFLSLQSSEKMALLQSTLKRGDMDSLVGLTIASVGAFVLVAFFAVFLWFRNRKISEQQAAIL